MDWKKWITACICIFWGLAGTAQTGRLLVNLVSHNEPDDSLEQQFKFFRMAYKVMDVADLVVQKGAKWNLGTCDGMVEGSLNWQSAGTTNTDMFEVLMGPPYAGHVEIDPRNKNKGGRNIADLAYLIDSTGAQASRNMSGFLWHSTQPTQPDWFQYEDTVLGNVYPHAWKAEVMWGAGSLPSHSLDLNDYGTWKPDTVDNFYAHKNARSLYYQGNGCQPLQALDSLESVQTIIDLIQSNADSITQGLWSDTMDYAFSIVINQSQFGPMLRQKLAMLMDSVNALDTNVVRWATISEKHQAYLARTGGLKGEYWACAPRLVAVTPPAAIPTVSAYPNPFSGTLRLQLHDDALHEVMLYDLLGRERLRAQLTRNGALTTQQLQPGQYLLFVDGQRAGKVLKMD